jgi:hypothetical protein
MRRMTSGDRAAAWLVTGPVGHFAAAVADWTVLLWRYWSARRLGRS